MAAIEAAVARMKMAQIPAGNGGMPSDSDDTLRLAELTGMRRMI